MLIPRRLVPSGLLPKTAAVKTPLSSHPQRAADRLKRYDQPGLVPVKTLVAHEVVKTSADGALFASKKTRGTYKGKPSSPDVVKFKVDFQGIPVNVERPKGFVMMGVDGAGKPWSRQYKLDYGHIPKTLGGDGDGLDVFLGPDKKATHAFWAVQRFPNGDFDEYKVFLGFADRDAALAAYRAHIPKKLLRGMMTMRVEMMKAMLGINPSENLTKTACAAYYLLEALN